MDSQKKSTSQNQPTDFAQVSKAEHKSVEPSAAPSRDGYFFGGIKEFNLEQIESEVLSESIYVDVFAGSDLALKKDIQNTGPALEAICRLETIRYKWNENSVKDFVPDEATHIGLIAQQVATEFPELVRKDTTTGFLAVNYAKLSVHLVSALKEMRASHDELTQRVSNLEKLLSTKN